MTPAPHPHTLTFSNDRGIVNTIVRYLDPGLPQAPLTILMPLVGQGVGFTRDEVLDLRDFLNHHFPKETE